MKATYNQHFFETTSIPAFLLMGWETPGKTANQDFYQWHQLLIQLNHWFPYLQSEMKGLGSWTHIIPLWKKVSKMSFRKQSLKISDEKGVNLTHHMVKQPFSVSVRRHEEMRVLSRESLGFWNPQAALFVLRMQLWGWLLPSERPGRGIPYKRSFKKKGCWEHVEMGEIISKWRKHLRGVVQLCNLRIVNITFLCIFWSYQFTVSIYLVGLIWDLHRSFVRIYNWFVYTYSN